MKVLSLTQPYAELNKEGCKTIETRSWKTEYRGKAQRRRKSTGDKLSPVENDSSRWKKTNDGCCQHRAMVITRFKRYDD